jgi:hypothetical protein
MKCTSPPKANVTSWTVAAVGVAAGGVVVEGVVVEGDVAEGGALLVAALTEDDAGAGGPVGLLVGAGPAEVACAPGTVGAAVADAGALAATCEGGDALQAAAPQAATRASSRTRERVEVTSHPDTKRLPDRRRRAGRQPVSA